MIARPPFQTAKMPSGCKAYERVQGVEIPAIDHVERTRANDSADEDPRRERFDVLHR